MVPDPVVPSGTVHEAADTVWDTPGPVIVHEVLMALAVHLRVVVPPERTRAGVAVISAVGVPTHAATETTGHCAGAVAPVADTCMP